jgi:hypothetical protein
MKNKHRKRIILIFFQNIRHEWCKEYSDRALTYPFFVGWNVFFMRNYSKIKDVAFLLKHVSEIIKTTLFLLILLSIVKIFL